MLQRCSGKAQRNSACRGRLRVPTIEVCLEWSSSQALAIAPVIGLGRMVGAVAASRARSGTTSRRAGGPRWSVTVPQARRAKRTGQSYPPGRPRAQCQA
jgi:hypothetical protein